MPTRAFLLAVLKDRGTALAGVILLIYGPFYLLDGFMRWTIPASPEDIDRMTGVLGALLVPIVNGGLVKLIDGYTMRHPADVFEALAISARSWRRLFVSYLAASFVFLGHAALWVLPGALLLLVTKQLETPMHLIPFALPALFVLTRFMFLDSFTVLEGLEPYEARIKSSDLAKPMRWKIAGLAALTMGPPMALDALSGEISGQWLGAGTEAAIALASTLGILAGLLTMVSSVVFYEIYKRSKSPGGMLPDVGRAAKVLSLSRAR